jgi:hypothetical protein
MPSTLLLAPGALPSRSCRLVDLRCRICAHTQQKNIPKNMHATTAPVPIAAFSPNEFEIGGGGGLG